MQGRGRVMRTQYTRTGGGSRPAPRGLQKVLSAEQIQSIIRRETSRADRTGRQFSVVLFRVKDGPGARRVSVSTCRVARVLLSRVRQTDDVGWFDDRHLCAVLPETAATGARVFASRACGEVARRQPRPLSVVYGSPGTFVSPGEPVEVHAVNEDGLTLTGHAVVAADRIRPRHVNGNGHANGNGNGNEHANVNGHVN